MKHLLLALLFTLSLFAQKVIYLSYDKVPQRVIKGEIASFTIKSISTVSEFPDISYEIPQTYGIKILDEFPLRDSRGKYFYDTFHFLTTSSSAKLPDIKASLIGTKDYDSSILKGTKLNVITLNPKKNFSNVIANFMELADYKTSSYDDNHNIVVFVISAFNANIKTMNFKGVKKQGIESISESYDESRITYYLVLKKEIQKFSFSYFNLLKNRFQMINVPIVVVDDSVVTQSDLKPKDQSHELLKVEIAAVISFLAFLFILWRKKYIYLIFVLLPIIYIAYTWAPQKDVCIKQGSQIHLLPVNNGTIFETTPNQYNLPKEGNVKNFVKVKLKNNKIGWVKNEDICSY
ncbi:MAG: hypothetical protein QM497_06405 [Sulfurimonas sp.]